MGIHDSNFKHNFGNERVARDFLLHNLPKEVLSKINIATLKVESNEFLPSRYRTKRRADIIYSVKDKEGKKLYTLLHLEGQSTHDKHMAIRVWEYHVAIAKSHLKQGNSKVPLILTFVLYHGKNEWSSATSISDLFGNFELYVNVSLRSSFLVNLNEKEIEELKGQGASSAPQLLMKGQAQGDYCSLLDDLYPLLKAYDLLDEENIDYIATNDEHEPEDFLKKLSNFDPETANHYKTMFERAIQRRVKTAVKTAVERTAREYKSIGRNVERHLWKKSLKEAESKGVLDKKAVGLLLKNVEEID